jgi:protein-L-isoaspartate(D-aspartate) O-methyltransferase
VAVVRTDGEFGEPQRAPYDRIVVTVTAWDIASAWLRQLRPGGRIVVPLRVRGQTRSIAFDLVEDHLESRSTTMCGFVSMQGVGGHYERLVPLQDSQLTFDEDQELAPHPPYDILASPFEQAWSGTEVGREEPLLDLYLWLATTLPGYCVLSGEEWSWIPAIATADSLAHLATRPGRDADNVELGCRGYGPQARALTDRMVRQVCLWHAKLRTGPGPSFDVHTVGSELPDGFHLRRRHNYLTVRWEAPDAVGC